MTDVYQTANIAAALPNSGTGLRVLGYNFGFTAKNGNGWDDGRVDYLTAYVNFNDAKNNPVFYKSYDLNYKFDWTAFNFSETFATPYATRDLSTVRYGFVGMDNNFWAGPYGPEIYNVNFNLKYTVDPCYVNVLSSPSCPGWADAMAKITATATAGTVQTDTTPLTTNTAITTSNTATVAPPITDAAATNTATTSTASVATMISPVPSTNLVATITNPTRQVAPLSTSTVLSGIRRNEEALQNTVNSTVQRSITSSIEAGTTALQQTQQQASQSQQNSIRDSEAQARQSSEASQSLINSAVSSNAAAAVAATINSAGATGLLTTGPVSGTPVIFGMTLPNATNAAAASSAGLTVQVQDTSTFNRSQPTVNNEVLSNTESPVTALTRPGDPIQAAKIGSPVTTTAVDSGVNTGAVVRNVSPPTQLAGGADFAAMSRATDINSYAQLRLQDAAFYQPREIYRGQRVVDNARVLRGLGSDRLHQRMVEQQYNLGN